MKTPSKVLPGVVLARLDFTEIAGCNLNGKDIYVRSVTFFTEETFINWGNTDKAEVAGAVCTSLVSPNQTLWGGHVINTSPVESSVAPTHKT